MNRRAALLDLPALVLAGGVRPASARPLDDVLRASELRVGVNPTLPPRAQFNEKNEIVGFEPDIAAMIA